MFFGRLDILFCEIQVYCPFFIELFVMEEKHSSCEEGGGRQEQSWRQRSAKRLLCDPGERDCMHCELRDFPSFGPISSDLRTLSST